MTYTFSIAQSDADRQAARAFAVGLNGAGFCPPDAPPHALINAVDSFRPKDIIWIEAREEGKLVGVLGEVMHPAEGIHNLNLVGAIDPTRYTDELASGLIHSVVDLLEYGGCCGEQWPYMAILDGGSPMVQKILDIYEPLGPVHQEPYGPPGDGLVKLTGMLNPGGLISVD